MITAFINSLCILPATALQFYYQSRAVAMKHPRAYVAVATAVSAIIWGINNFLCSPPVSILGNYLLALTAFPIGERLGLTAAQMMDTYGTSVTVMELLSFLELLLIFPFVDRLLHWLWNAPKALGYLLLFAPVPLSQAVLLNLIDRYVPQPGITVWFSPPRRRWAFRRNIWWTNGTTEMPSWAACAR